MTQKNRFNVTSALAAVALMTVGGHAAAQTPVAPIRLRVPVWHAGETGDLIGVGRGGPVKLTVTDYDNKMVWSGPGKPNKNGAITGAIPVGRPGYYTLSIEPAGFPAFNSSFVVVPAPLPGAATISVKTPPTRLILGVNTHFGQRDMPDDALEILRKMGVDAVRDEIGWGASEKEKNVYAFIERHKTLIQSLKKAGLPMLWSHSYGNKLYNEGRFPDNPAAREAYGRFGAEVLRRFGDNILAIEILNEPNKLDPGRDYLPILRSVHDAVRGAGFKHEIISVGGAGPAGGGMSPGFAVQLFAQGGAKYCDSFSQHPYMTPFTPDLGYAKGTAHLDAALGRAGALVEKYKLSGSWVTEVGWPALENGLTRTAETEKNALGTRAMVSEGKQAAFTARTLLGASRYPRLKGIFLYDFQDDGPDPLRREHRFGLVRQDLTPKPAYAAFAVTAHFLQNKTFVRALTAPGAPRLSGSLYRDDRGALWAAIWALETTRADLQNGTAPERHRDIENGIGFRVKGGGSAAATGYDWQGRPLIAGSSLTATARPLYLRLSGSGGKGEKNAIEIEKL